MTLDLKDTIRTIPDYPKQGIMFRDITTLLGDARAFRRAIDELVQPWSGTKIDKVAGIEERGLILGGAVAHQPRRVSCRSARKSKLPHQSVDRLFARIWLDEMEVHDMPWRPANA
jgi:adenine phosphoribosyltransferase